VSGERETRRQILLYTLILVPLGISPWLLGFAGWVYGGVAVVSGAAMLALAIRVLSDRTDRSAKQLFAFSILYLFLLFAFLLIDRVVGAHLGILG
jgi:protoheme IX farnesyltransferase